MSNERAKNILNEFFQLQDGDSAQYPVYVTERWGADHAPLFEATVTHAKFDGRCYASEGRFTRAKDAELSAAAAAWRNDPVFESSRDPPSVPHANPPPAAAQRALLIDLENQQGALRFAPRADDLVIGFVHRGGAVDISRAAFPIQVVEAAGKDAADVALLWTLAELVLGASPLRAGASIFVVSLDHIFPTAAAVLAEGARSHGHAVEVARWDEATQAIVAR